MASAGPDREFVDGEVVERNVGERQHSEIQARLVEILMNYARMSRPTVSPRCG